MDILLYLLRESWLVNVAWRSTVFLSLLYVLSPLLRKMSPALSHMIVLTALIGVMVFPLLIMILPAWELPLLEIPVGKVTAVEGPGVSVDSPVGQGIIVSGILGAMAGQADPNGRLTVIKPETIAVEEVNTADTVRLITKSGPMTIRGLVILWLAGVVISIVAIGRAMVAACRLSRRATLLEDDRWIAMLEHCRRMLGVRRLISLRVTDEVAVPMVWGFRRPVLFIPRSLVNSDDARMSMVVFHELAHIKRNDQWTRVLARLSCALNWFNPLVWRFYTLLLSTQEQACDALVLANGIRKCDYAAQLLAMARLLPGSRSCQTAALGMARSGAVESRVRSILNQQPHTKESTMTTKGFSFMIMCAIVAVLASMQPFISGSVQAGADEEKKTAVVTSSEGDQTVEKETEIKVIVTTGDDEGKPVTISGEDKEKVIVIRKKEIDQKVMEQALEAIEQAKKQLEAVEIDRETMRQQLEQARQSIEQSRQQVDIVADIISDLDENLVGKDIFNDELMAEIKAEMKKAGKSDEEIERVMSKLQNLNISISSESGGEGKEKNIIIKKRIHKEEATASTNE